MTCSNCLHHINIAIKLGYILKSELIRLSTENKLLCNQDQTLITSLIKLNKLTPSQAKNILINQAQTRFTVKQPTHKINSQLKKNITNHLTELDKKYRFILNIKNNQCLKLDLIRWANEAGITTNTRKEKKELLHETKQLIKMNIRKEHDEVFDLVDHCF